MYKLINSHQKCLVIGVGKVIHDILPDIFPLRAVVATEIAHCLGEHLQVVVALGMLEGLRSVDRVGHSFGISDLWDIIDQFNFNKLRQTG